MCTGNICSTELCLTCDLESEEERPPAMETLTVPTVGESVSQSGTVVTEINDGSARSLSKRKGKSGEIGGGQASHKIRNVVTVRSFYKRRRSEEDAAAAAGGATEERLLRLEVEVRQSCESRTAEGVEHASGNRGSTGLSSDANLNCQIVSSPDAKKRRCPVNQYFDLQQLKMQREETCKKKARKDEVEMVMDKLLHTPPVKRARGKPKQGKNEFKTKSQTRKDEMTSRNASLTLAAKEFEVAAKLKKYWQEVPLVGFDHRALVGRACKIFWPLDVQWYPGVVHEYNSATGKYKVLYEESESEWLLLSNERVKLLVTPSEHLDVTSGKAVVQDIRKCNSFEDGINETGRPMLSSKQVEKQPEFCHGELVWSKVKGFPDWPAMVLDEEHAIAAGLKGARDHGPSKVALQFFGTFEFAVQSRRSCHRLSWGLEARFHTKSHSPAFLQALEQLERYLTENVVPPQMASSVGNTVIYGSVDDGEEVEGKAENMFQQPQMPLVVGPLTVLSLGKVVTDSEHFHSDKYIWPEGYMAMRKFPSSKDVTQLVEYRMEILRKSGKLVFRVTPVDGKPVEADNPGRCWTTLQNRVIHAKEKLLQSNRITVEELPSHFINSGPAQFGFALRQVARMIQALPNAKKCTKFQAWLTSPPEQAVVPAGYSPQKYTWQHGDRCSVCYIHEEYEDNQLLHCDSCRMMVHMDCYGVDAQPDGDLWLCDVCDAYTPEAAPPCCLCPVQGGAMKKTSDGNWAHVACAIWIPETMFEGLKVIRGVAGINKARWKLLCSICHVPYGACIQCTVKNCCVAYHPLCARKEGLTMELKEVNDEANQRSRQGFRGSVYGNLEFISCCRRHNKSAISCSLDLVLKSPSTVSATIAKPSVQEACAWQPPANPSGCARSEPFNAAVRRGRREPDALAAAMTKRNFVENLPYILSSARVASLANRGKMPPVRVAEALWNWHWIKGSAGRWKAEESGTSGLPSNPVQVHKSNEEGTTAKDEVLKEEKSLFSMSDRFRKMQGSLHARLVFGKSAIHGWGLFAKAKHKAGDMMIEYAGEVVRPIIADIRERRCYDSLVGAGTYMFRIDAERVVDATRSGSMAHLINHSCHPNCYSRVVTAGKEDHIVIFAKRDIIQGEELTYDYRFNSKDELLPCHCGSAVCRGVVNIDDDDDDRLMARRSELSPWQA